MAYTDDELDEIDRQYKERYGMTPHEEFLHNQKRFDNPVCDKEEVVEVDEEPIAGDTDLHDEGYFLIKTYFGF